MEDTIFGEATTQARKDKKVTRADLDDFVSCYHADNRLERQETERFRRFSYDELVKRDKAKLNRSQGEMRIWEEVKQWSTSVSQVQVEELQRVT